MLPPVTDQPEGDKPTRTHAPDRTKNAPTPRRDAPHGQQSGLDRFFKISERGSTLERELRGGIVTFFTMAYIIVLNPLILGFAPDKNGHFLGGGSGDGSNLPAIAAGHGPGGRRDDDPDGRRRELPARAGRPGSA